MNKIKQARLEKGYTIQQLADKSGISAEKIIIIENMSVEELRQLLLPTYFRWRLRKTKRSTIKKTKQKEV